MLHIHVLQKFSSVSLFTSFYFIVVAALAFLSDATQSVCVRARKITEMKTILCACELNMNSAINLIG